MIILRQRNSNKAAYEGLGLIKRLKLRSQRGKIAKNLKESVKKADLEHWNKFSPFTTGNTDPEYTRAFMKQHSQMKGINRKIAIQDARSAAEQARKNLL